MEKKKVLFLCTGNSARSQMAEGLVNFYLGDRWQAYSAGTQPSGFVHPLAVQAMAELGIDISGQRSKGVGEFRSLPFDVVMTLCDGAAQSCPLWLGARQVTHLAFPDPAAAPGSKAQRLEAFRRVRDALRERVLKCLEEMEKDPAPSVLADVN